MSTQCTPTQLEFHGFGRREVVARFDGGRLTSDGGGTLLREVDRRLGLMAGIARCFADHRDPRKVEHTVPELVAQRVHGLELGHEDLNDHDALRGDSLLALLVGKVDPTGEKQPRERDRGCPLAGPGTLNRLGLGGPEDAAGDRCRRIAADTGALDDVLMDVFLESQAEAPTELWLNLDATDDPLHGCHKGCCCLPLYIFCGEHLLCARLRPSDGDASGGSVEELERLVGRMRGRWPGTRIVVRGDSGLCREEIMRWCEDNGVDHVLGLARRTPGEADREGAAQVARAATGAASRRFREFRCRTLDSWSQSRRVVAKAEHLAKGRTRASWSLARLPQLSAETRATP